MKEGTYNEYVKNHLTPENRTGTIIRNDYWRAFPEVKENYLKDFSKSDYDEFIRLMDGIKEMPEPNGRLEAMTSGLFFRCCALGYEANHYQGCELSPKEQYLKHADGRDEGLRGIDENSSDAFETWYNDRMAVFNGRMNEEAVLCVDEEVLSECMNRRSLLYDKNGEEHYNLISALHKSMRNSDPDAAVYWMYRMLDGGEDPLYIARRLVRFASEDVGMADSNALQMAVAVYQACHFLGMPECDVHLAHAVVYLSMAPKSNALYRACSECKEDIRSMPAQPVPLQICNAPTNLMKEMNYGKGYIYAHDTEEKMARMQCLPETLKDRHYYEPTDEGQEKQIKERLERIREWKAERES